MSTVTSSNRANPWPLFLILTLGSIGGFALAWKTERFSLGAAAVILATYYIGLSMVGLWAGRSYFEAQRARPAAHPWYHFTLRELLLIAGLAAVAVAWWREHAQQVQLRSSSLPVVESQRRS